MVSNLITGLLVSFRTDWPRRQEAMKTAGSENQNRCATMRSKPSTWNGRLEQILFNHAGWKARKPPAKGEVFFLTFLFIDAGVIVTQQQCESISRITCKASVLSFHLKIFELLFVCGLSAVTFTAHFDYNCCNNDGHNEDDTHDDNNFRSLAEVLFNITNLRVGNLD
jgi:hypothetical protein